MKNIVFAFILGTILLGCNTKEMEEKITQLQQENQKLLAETNQKDKTLTTFMESFAEVEKNLGEIRAREMNIEMSKEENLSSEDLKERIAADVQEINRLITENKETISKLNVKLKNSTNENVRLNNTMQKLQKELEEQVAQREERITTLNTELEKMHGTVEELNTNLASLKESNTEKEQSIEQKIQTLNTAYYVSGEAKDLENKEIIDKEGGFLGLGRTEKLKDNFSQDQFTKIDIRETVLFPVDGDKIELVTSHPTDSYKIEKDETGENLNLVVSNPEKFWESSKYLVMVVK